MKLPILIIGAGGHAAVVADALLAAGERVLDIREDLQAFPDAGHQYHLLGPSVGPLVPASPREIGYLFPYTRKSFSPATGLYSPSCRAFIPFSHTSFFDEVWNVVSPTNLF